MAEGKEQNTQTMTSDTSNSKMGPIAEPAKNIEGSEDLKAVSDKTFTEKEVQALLQRESDKRVTEAQKKWKEQLDSLKAEIEMAKLSEEDRAKELMKKKEQELIEKEREIRKREMDFETMRLLAQEKLPAELIEVFEGVDDLEKREKAIRRFVEIKQESVNTAIRDKERGSFLPNSHAGKALTREQLKAMTPKQINDIFNSNPELLPGLNKKP